MTHFSKKFLSLVESMKYDSSIIERREKTSAGKDKERTKTRTQRAEKEFSEESGKFNIRSFIKALKLLSTQIYGEINKVSLAIKTQSDGHKFSDPIITGLRSQLKITQNLINNAETRFKEEGGELETGVDPENSDAETISIWRDQYLDTKKKFEASSLAWIDAVNRQTKERPVDLQNSAIDKSLEGAKKLFDEAKKMLVDMSSKFANLSVNNNSKGQNDNSNNSGGSEIKITIKEGQKSYTKEENDIIIDIKKTIYDKLNKATVYTKQSFWKEVYKNYPNITSIFGPNTGLLIKSLKRDFKLTDANSSDITPLFYKSVKDFTIKESIDNSWGKLLSFESFMKSKINEENDGGGLVIDLSKSEESIEKAKESSTSSSKSSSKSTNKSKSSSGDDSSKSTVPSEPATPFKTKEEGNKFREWVNKKYPDWAKENDLDTSGSENNSYIRKAYAQYGEEYNKSTSTPEVKKMDGKEMNSLLDKLKTYSKKVELQLTTATGEPVILFYSGKAYGHLYNNYRVIYTNTEGGKKQWNGTYDPAKGTVTFPGGKSWKLEYVVKCTITEGLSMDKENLEKVKKADELLIKMSEMIVTKFGEASFWKPFKGRFNDDEDAAVAAFSKWYGKSIEDAYYNPAINRINQLPNSKAKTNLLKNTTERNRFQFDKLINKLYGSSGTDNYKWTIYKSDGTTKDYNVDTDF